MNVFSLHYVVIIDVSAIIMLYLLSSLSKSLGEALKTPKYFVFFHVGIAMVALSALIDVMSTSGLVHLPPGVPSLLSLLLRACAGIVAVLTAWRYWSWLFPEFFRD